MSPKSNSATLMPTPVDISIGERTYVIRPLTLRSTTQLLRVVSDELSEVANDPALQAIFNQDMDGMSVTEMIPMFVRAISRIPNALPRFIAVIVNANPDDEAEVNFLDEYTGFGQALKIFKTFIDLNEPEELMANFFELRSVLETAVTAAQKKN